MRHNTSAKIIRLLARTATSSDRIWWWREFRGLADSDKKCDFKFLVEAKKGSWRMIFLIEIHHNRIKCPGGFRGSQQAHTVSQSETSLGPMSKLICLEIHLKWFYEHVWAIHLQSLYVYTANILLSFLLLHDFLAFLGHLTSHYSIRTHTSPAIQLCCL